jgi:uncharacterized protein
MERSPAFQKMTRTLIFLIPFLALILILVGIIRTFTSVSRNTVRIGTEQFILERVDTEATRERGLSGRASMEKDHGMLFVFPTPGILTFWMKEMNFPLDFIWIRGTTVVDLTEDAPAPLPNQPLETLTMYSPKTEADRVIELTAGSIKRIGIQIGDTIRL